LPTTLTLNSVKCYEIMKLQFLMLCSFSCGVVSWYDSMVFQLDIVTRHLMLCFQIFLFVGIVDLCCSIVGLVAQSV